MAKRKRGRQKRPSQIPEPLDHQRAEPYCIHFEHCGGCTLQHFTYDAQLEIKQELVDKAFARESLSELMAEAPPALAILPAERQRGYRNKLEYTFSRRRWLTPQEIAQEQTFEFRDGAGFHVRGFFNRVLDLQECWHQPEPSNQMRLFLRDAARAAGISFYDIAENEGDLRTLMVRTSESGQTMAIVMFSGEFDQPKQQLMADFAAAFPDTHSLYYIINNTKNSSPIGHQPVLFYGQECINEQCGHLNLRIHPASFFQTNTSQATRLYRLVASWAALDGTQLVYDLYSGIGSIGLFLADKAKKVIGIEVIADAVDGAKENAELNGLHNAQFFCGEAEKLCDQSFFAEHGTPDLIIVDPPRPGLHKNLIAGLLQIQSPRILYISCNPGTQADDLEQLGQKYRIVRHQAVDMFPQTMHVENVVELALR